MKHLEEINCLGRHFWLTKILDPCPINGFFPVHLQGVYFPPFVITLFLKCYLVIAVGENCLLSFIYTIVKEKLY